jgi:hypothetical protein
MTGERNDIEDIWISLRNVLCQWIPGQARPAGYQLLE